jgi:hypothetical protein
MTLVITTLCVNKGSDKATSPTDSFEECEEDAATLLERARSIDGLLASYVTAYVLRTVVYYKILEKDLLKYMINKFSSSD